MPIRNYIIVAALFICSSLSAQTAQPSITADSIVPAKNPYSRNFTQLVYASLFGPTIFAGLNYDIRFNGTSTGLGARVGLGMVPDYHEAYYNKADKALHYIDLPAAFTVPFGLNYVMGAKKHFIEFGVGMIYLGRDSLMFDDITTNYTWLGWFEINYRRAVGKHLVTRWGFTNIISSRYAFPLSIPEFGMGYRF
ncbi:hypothetical protein AB6805_09680 [Chitinophaga sp. RCC_12]|uniref:hypothetical protein n=1 Tax=Chitinophaga sp. RCC_12 TaxID=3239226 RepID=UPI0035240BB9